MRTAGWITKAKNTHSEYVILIAFPLQHWLHERASMLRLYVHCLSYCNIIVNLTHLCTFIGLIYSNWILMHGMENGIGICYREEMWLLWNSSWMLNVMQSRCISFCWGLKFILYFLERPVFSVPVDHETPNYCCRSPPPPSQSPTPYRRPTSPVHSQFVVKNDVSSCLHIDVL
jgi:hypothetical protein